MLLSTSVPFVSSWLAFVGELGRLLLLMGLGAGFSLLALGARGLTRRRLRRLERLGTDGTWRALQTAPDGRPAVVVFSTPACAACRTAQKPAVAALERRAAGGVRVLEIDAAAHPDTAQVFGVLTVPATAVLDRTGRVAALNHGFATTDRLADQLSFAEAAV